MEDTRLCYLGILHHILVFCFNFGEICNFAESDQVSWPHELYLTQPRLSITCNLFPPKQPSNTSQLSLTIFVFLESPLRWFSCIPQWRFLCNISESSRIYQRLHCPRWQPGNRLEIKPRINLYVSSPWVWKVLNITTLIWIVLYIWICWIHQKPFELSLAW